MEKERNAMARNVLDFEPATVLFVPDTNPLLYYEAIAARSFPALSPRGVVLVEINEQLGRETVQCFERSGYQQVRFSKTWWEGPGCMRKKNPLKLQGHHGHKVSSCLG